MLTSSDDKLQLKYKVNTEIDLFCPNLKKLQKFIAPSFNLDEILGLGSELGNTVTI